MRGQVEERHGNRLLKLLPEFPEDKWLDLLEPGGFDPNQERQCHFNGAANEGDAHHLRGVVWVQPWNN